MTQNDLNRAVSRATGETISEINHLGFSLAMPEEPAYDPEPSPWLDWDEVDAMRPRLLPC
ncbi:MAG: hypothetical protein WEA31_09485 [Pirellulales bacterium]